MPELPEAETIVRDLQRVVGRTIAGTRVSKADIIAPATPAQFSRRLRGRTIARITRRAKKPVIHFDNDLVLVISLGMTGRVVLSSAARVGELRHIAVRLELDDGTALLYDDARRFGSLELFDGASWQLKQQGMGLEPLADEFTAGALFALTRGTMVPIRNWLLDQRHVVGIGNIYAAEALHRAGVRPTRRARTLTRAEAARLREAIRDVLAQSIDYRGTTLSDYRDASGEEGAFEARLQVYDRAGRPCPRCGSSIKRVVLTNRSAFYCPQCQK